jgi:hypothetical protein
MAKRRKTPLKPVAGPSTQVHSLISLNRDMEEICQNGGDAFASRLPSALAKFAQIAVTKRSYEFKLLPAKAFIRISESIFRDSRVTSIDYNRINNLFFSHLLRTVEAYEIVTLWRAEVLARGCVNCLNAGLAIPAAISSRSLVELAERYLMAANDVDHYSKQVSWAQFGTHVITPKIPIDDKRDEALENYIERLFWGSRLEERVNSFPGIEERNTLSYIDKLDKISKKRTYGWSIRKDYYDFLCEVAHPNYVGNARYAEKKSLEGDWEIYSMSAQAQKGD